MCQVGDALALILEIFNELAGCHDADAFVLSKRQQVAIPGGNVICSSPKRGGNDMETTLTHMACYLASNGHICLS
jgi:hypothetical protein